MSRECLRNGLFLERVISPLAHGLTQPIAEQILLRIVAERPDPGFSIVRAQLLAPHRSGEHGDNHMGELFGKHLQGLYDSLHHIGIHFVETVQKQPDPSRLLQRIPRRAAWQNCCLLSGYLSGHCQPLR